MWLPEVRGGERSWMKVLKGVNFQLLDEEVMNFMLAALNTTEC